MEREDIEKAALEHAMNETGLDYIGEVAYENGFVSGAEWMIDALGKMQPTEVWKEITKRAGVRSSDEK